jgi:hypothetical protein
MGHVFPNTNLTQWTPTTPVIATKYYDPPFVAGGYGCPAGQLCRSSDAAAYAISGNYSYYFAYFTGYPNYPGFGKTYRTVAPLGDSLSSGSADIDSVAGPWQVTKRSDGALFDFLAVGERVMSVGAATGTKVGPVQQICVTTAEYKNSTTLLGTTLWCQDLIGIKSLGTDSGSPVVVQTGTTTVVPIGILWGGGQFTSGPLAGTYQSSISRMVGISADFADRIGHDLRAMY